ncbi:hypothetical protein B0H14DRAFT_2576965 [Mycena olivaceomarginata]|nr:hypothetical protein B0H14DRAFT_2576965 [Mycena olivaceomarginata]
MSTKRDSSPLALRFKVLCCLVSFCAGVAQCVVVKMEIVAHVNGAHQQKMAWLRRVLELHEALLSFGWKATIATTRYRTLAGRLLALPTFHTLGLQLPSKMLFPDAGIPGFENERTQNNLSPPT